MQARQNQVLPGVLKCSRGVCLPFLKEMVEIFRRDHTDSTEDKKRAIPGSYPEFCLLSTKVRLREGMEDGGHFLSLVPVGQQEGTGCMMYMVSALGFSEF